LTRLTILIIAIFLIPANLVAVDEASLQAAHQMLIQAVDKSDVEMLISTVHPRAVAFFRPSQQPVQLTRTNSMRELAPSLLADLAKFSATTYGRVYRVYGDTGVVLATVAMTPVAGMNKKKRTEYDRATYVYNRSSQGKWMLVSWHTSATPLNP